jgi:hypothetical protein
VANVRFMVYADGAQVLLWGAGLVGAACEWVGQGLDCLLTWPLLMDAAKRDHMASMMSYPSELVLLGCNECTIWLLHDDGCAEGP